MTVVTGNNTRVSTIRHIYRSGTEPVYKMVLGLGKIVTLPNYEEELDNLKEEMKTDAIESAIQIVEKDVRQATFDKLINKPAEEMGYLPNLQKIWKKAQNKSVPEIIVDTLKIKSYDVEKPK